MGTDWGAYENSGGRGIRCGITYTPQTVNHGDNNARIDLDFLTQNNAKYNNDAQTLNISGAITTSINYTNDQGTGVQTRGSRTFTYSYGGNEYGTSPGSMTVKSLLAGADNGVTPGVQVTVAIPARPYGPPAPCFFQSANTNSDTSVIVQWAQQPTAGEPYQNVYVDRYTYGFEGWTRIYNGGATTATVGSINAGAQANRKYTYRIWPANSAGSAGAVQTNDQWTSPAAPASFTRTTSGTTQQLTWVNNVGYPEYKLEIWESVNGGAFTLLTGSAGLAAGTTSANYTGRPTTNTYTYQIRSTATATTGTYSNTVTSSTSVVITPPSAPTGMTPNGDPIIDPTNPVALSWTHNPTDGTAQSAFEIQHRLVGSGTWTSSTKVTSTTSTYTLSLASYGNDKHIEWQVRTYGLDPTASPWSASATFYTAPAVPAKYNLVLNAATGRVEALTSGAPAGTGTANAYYYEQNYAAATTTVSLTHNLGTKGLEIEFWDNVGVRRYGDITKTTNAISMAFTNAVAGTMIVYGAVHA